MKASHHGASVREFGRIGFSEEQADLLDVATKFCRENSPMEKVRKLMTTEDGFDREVWRQIADLGWLGIAIAEDYEGGAGLSLAEVVPVVEQMGRTMMATPFVSTTLANQAIAHAGTPEQKSRLLPQLNSGTIATIAIMEPEGSWDFGKISARATGQGNVTLSGQKNLVCDADVSAIIIASVQRDNEPALVIINRDQLLPAAIRRDLLIDETKRSYTLNLDGVTCREDAFLDPTRIRAALSHLQLAASLLSAAETCGGAQSVIDYTIDYLQTRKQFGKVIGSYQALKHPMVDAFVSYQQARSHLYSAAHCFNEQGTGEIATRMAKATADTALSFAADRSIQFHGGFGFTYDCDAQLYRRRAAWHAAVYGDAMYHKRKLAALMF